MLIECGARVAAHFGKTLFTPHFPTPSRMGFVILIGKKFRFSSRELFDMLVSAVVITFIFGYEQFIGASFQKLIAVGAIYFLIVGLAFILHETAHKLTAQSFGCWSEYRMWMEGLLIALVMRIFIGFTFIAPGAAYFSPFRHGIPLKEFELSKNDVGKIGAAGPAMNIVLAFVFYILWISGILTLTMGDIPVALLGAYVNFVLALFNMIPIPPLDGHKIFKWSIPIYIAMVVVIIASCWVMGIPLPFLS